MDCSGKLDSDYLAMVELTKEIGFLVQRSINRGDEKLTSSDIEHILKMTSDVTLGIKSKEIRFKIEHMSIMTLAITEKLKKILLVNR